MKTAILTLVLFLGPATVDAQIDKAPASPRARLTQQVGLTEVSLDYGRPGVKGRRIFGGLEPYGRVWRTGANASTKIGFGDDVTFGGHAVPKGTYALYTIPGEAEWTVLLHGKTDLWGAGGYDEANDVARVRVPVVERADLQETLLIDLEGFHQDGAELVIVWEHTKVSVPIGVDTESRVIAQIEEKIFESGGEVSAATYFDAGMYFYEKRIDLEQAAEWVDRAVGLEPEAFWRVYYQAEIAHARDDRQKARVCAEKALELATASPRGDFGFIAKCKLLLEKL